MSTGGFTDVRPRQSAAGAACVLLLLLLPAGAGASLRAPRPEAPAAATTVRALPAFTWKPVAHAALYEFQLSADRRFGSTLLTRRTPNTAATTVKTVQDGQYFWRVRAVSAADRAGAWSATRAVTKDWSSAPELQSPSEATAVNWPSTPLALRWSAVPGAAKYLVSVGTDPGLSTLVAGSAAKPVETEGTAFALPTALPGGTYYWAVTAVDAQGFKGRRSRVGSFSWSWPSGTAARYADLNDAEEAVDPQLSWDAVAGAARYDLEINPSQDFAVGSKVCCTDAITGTSYSPPKVLPNNTYYWRVRPIDPDANAGAWTTGQPFTKAFDAVATPIRDLRVENSQGAGVAGGSTPDPVVRWTPVPGASGYEVRGYQWTGSSCNFASIRWDDTTEAPAWTPLGNGPKPRIGSGAWPAPSTQAFPSVARGLTYCVQVRAYTDTDFRGQPVVGPATDLRPAFTYAPLPAPGPSSEMQASDYLAPLSGTVEARMPVFTWKPVTQASGYYVVVARDPDFTKVIDVAFTTTAAYAPRLRDRPISYADETTHYYWAVVPEGTDGVATLPPAQDSPRAFDKRSVPPALLAPGAGAEVPTQPVFRWTPAEGARNYRLQVATDPDFGDLLEDTTTASTAFTTGLTYPADTALYWRVRANDDAGTGLTWSDRGRFVRRLPAPVPAAANTAFGTTPPLWTWSPVDGATGYDVHLDQGDGTQSDLATSVAAFSATAARGVGIINWKVRARFPSGRSGSVFGGYGAPQSFVRSIPAPAGAKGTRSGARLLVSWQPVGGIKSYRVEVSSSSGFGRIVDSVTTDLTTWAPDTSRPVYVTGGRLYWRIRALDTRNAAGAAATGAFTLPRSFTLSSAGLLRHGRTSSVTITVRGAGAKAMRGVGVRVAGAGVRARTRRTGRRGTATFRLRPSRRGTVVVRAAAKGYRATTLRLAVR